MKTKTRLIKSLSMVIGLAAVLVLAHGYAQADEVTITGSTTGTVFGFPQLTFTGNPNFTATTRFNHGALSGANSLGTFSLGGADDAAISGSFVLNVTFLTPTNITGGQNWNLVATFVGTVTPNVDQGGVAITFAPSIYSFDFQEGTDIGSFSLIVPTVFVQTGRDASLTAGLVGARGSTVPEPVSLVLLGTGLSGIALKLRRRRKLLRASIPPG